MATAEGGQRRRRDRGAGAAPVLPTRVPEVLRALARWAVASSMGLAPACAGDASEAEREWEPIGCGTAGGETPKLLDTVEPGEVDYVGIYGQARSAPPVPGPLPSVWVYTERGSPCSGALHVDECNAQLAALRVPDAACMERGECDRFLITTAGDGATRRDDRAMLLALLGPIADRERAAVVAIFDGYAMACPQTKPQPLSGTQTRKVADGFEIRTEWDQCGEGLFRQTLHVKSDGTLEPSDRQKIGQTDCHVGRRPAGLCATPHARGVSPLPAFLAQAARLEAASVYAFERLARELAQLGAPATLITDARHSARDEVRHAHAMSALARRFGGEPIAPVISDLPERAPALIALENAVEGCVRESYGALLAHHQAQCALDPEVRAVMRAIAGDETRHAQLSWRVAHWLEPRLALDAQRALAFARSAALAGLLREIDPGFSPVEARAIGWPAPELERALITRLGTALQIG